MPPPVPEKLPLFIEGLAKIRSALKLLETCHRFIAAFYAPIVLFEPIVSVLVSSVFNISTQNFLDCPRVAGLFVGCYLLRFMTDSADCLLEESRGTFQSPFIRQFRFNQAAFTVDGPVQIMEFPSYSYQPFILFPTQIGLSIAAAFEVICDQGSEFVLPTPDCDPGEIKSFKFDTEHFRQFCEGEFVTQPPQYDLEKISCLDLTSIEGGTCSFIKGMLTVFAKNVL